MHSLAVAAWFIILGVVLICSALAEAPRLKVSDNRRFLVQEDGTPFFWLGDTAWELFHRLNREDAELYLHTRAEQGFTVIQAVALAELDGLNTPNVYGHHPLIDNDPARPDVKDGPANDYWDHVDFVVQTANSLGLVMALLPTWGDKWNAGDNEPVLNPANAEVYGEWLGRRYAESAVVWVLGGDREVTGEGQYATLRALARGLERGDNGRHLMTFHPRGGHGSSEYFHNDDWLDFNMRQNGHVDTCDSYLNTHADYGLQPTKPVIDGEPLYEDHPLWFRPDERGHSVAADVRRALYWDLFGGACGHTYGHHSVWQMWAPPRKPVNRPLMPWKEALQQPGARQMKYGRFLMESRPFLTRIPDDSVIVPDQYPSAVPGKGRYRFMSTRDSEGSYAMVYAPVGRAFSVRMDKISGGNVRAWCYDPRNGEALLIGEFPAEGQREFTSPTPGEELDWILVLDDATRGFGAPGRSG